MVFADATQRAIIDSEGVVFVRFFLALIAFIFARGVRRIAVAQLLDRIDARGLEQFGILFADAAHAHQVGKVAPLQDLLFAAAGSFRKRFAPFRRRTGFQ